MSFGKLFSSGDDLVRGQMPPPPPLPADSYGALYRVYRDGRQIAPPLPRSLQIDQLIRFDAKQPVRIGEPRGIVAGIAFLSFAPTARFQ